MDSVPTVCFRLDQQEILAIRAGLLSLAYHVERLGYRDPELTGYIEDLWNSLYDLGERNPEAKSHRVRTDALGLAILEYAVRAFRRKGTGTMVAEPPALCAKLRCSETSESVGETAKTSEAAVDQSESGALPRPHAAMASVPCSDAAREAFSQSGEPTPAAPENVHRNDHQEFACDSEGRRRSNAM